MDNSGVKSSPTNPEAKILTPFTSAVIVISLMGWFIFQTHEAEAYAHSITYGKIFPWAVIFIGQFLTYPLGLWLLSVCVKGSLSRGKDKRGVQIKFSIFSLVLLLLLVIPFFGWLAFLGCTLLFYKIPPTFFKVAVDTVPADRKIITPGIEKLLKVAKILWLFQSIFCVGGYGGAAMATSISHLSRAQLSLMLMPLNIFWLLPLFVSSAYIYLRKKANEGGDIIVLQRWMCVAIIVTPILWVLLYIIISRYCSYLI